MSDTPNQADMDHEDAAEESSDNHEILDKFFKCELCQTGFTEIEDFEDHIEERHYDQPAEVREEYGDRFDSVLDDAESDLEDDEGVDGDDYPDETNTSEVSETDEEHDTLSPESLQTGDSASNQDSSQTIMGNKWYVVGVGGAGGRIVDSILIRKDSLEDTSDPLAGVWQQALTGHTILNTNHNDITNTFYYQDLNSEWTENDLLNGSTLGIDHTKNDFTGTGQNWKLAREFVEHDFDDGENPIENSSGGYKIELDRISQSQAVMVANSVAGGTGCGAAPIIAREIKNLDLGKNKKIFGSLVLPSEKEAEDEMSAEVNGCAGTARMARYVDAILVFENGHLETANSELEDTEGLEIYEQYEEKNNAILKYFEIFSMASIDDAEILGDDFDINDAIEPINQLRPIEKEYYEDDFDDEENHDFPEPGNVLAPVIARSQADEMTAQSIEMLAERALNQNKLADFDPATAWGGTFVFFGPSDKLNSDLVYDNFKKLVEDEYIETPDEEYSYVKTDHYVISVDGLDSVYLWGFLWNPKIDSINRMYDAADHVKGGGKRLAKGLDEIWPTIEGLQKLMGRENMG